MDAYDVVVINDTTNDIHVSNSARVIGWLKDISGEEDQYLENALNIKASKLNTPITDFGKILDGFIYSDTIYDITHSSNIVYVLDGELPIAMAVITTNTDRKRWHVSMVYVDKTYRGKGIGLKLMNKIKQWGKEDGMVALSLTVFKSNKAAVKLYEKMGFKYLDVKFGLKCDNKPIIYKEPNIAKPYFNNYDVVAINNNEDPIFKEHVDTLKLWLGEISKASNACIKNTIKVNPDLYTGHAYADSPEIDCLIYNETSDDGLLYQSNLVLLLDGEKLMAMVAVQQISDSSSWNISHLYVDKEYRGKGITPQLLSKIMQWAVSEDVLCLFTHIPIDNKPANNQAKKMGLVPYLFTMGLKL